MIAFTVKGADVPNNSREYESWQKYIFLLLYQNDTIDLYLPGNYVPENW
jgi:hypothetical protein